MSQTWQCAFNIDSFLLVKRIFKLSNISLLNSDDFWYETARNEIFVYHWVEGKWKGVTSQSFPFWLIIVKNYNLVYMWTFLMWFYRSLWTRALLSSSFNLGEFLNNFSKECFLFVSGKIVTKFSVIIKLYSLTINSYRNLRVIMVYLVYSVKLWQLFVRNKRT